MKDTFRPDSGDGFVGTLGASLVPLWLSGVGLGIGVDAGYKYAARGPMLEAGLLYSVGDLAIDAILRQTWLSYGEEETNADDLALLFGFHLLF